MKGSVAPSFVLLAPDIPEIVITPLGVVMLLDAPAATQLSGKAVEPIISWFQVSMCQKSLVLACFNLSFVFVGVPSTNVKLGVVSSLNL